MLVGEVEIVAIRADGDVVDARRRAREIAAALGFSSGDLALTATAVSELARNILLYAGEGEIRIGLVEEDRRRGVRVVARDQGPGIADIELALRDGFSTSDGLGLGLPGCRRIFDNFEIQSDPGHGTIVTITKWALR